MALTKNTLEAYTKALRIPMGQKFYASDYELNSGHILALKYAGLIEKTGVTKTVLISPFPRTQIEVDVTEWVKVKEIYFWANEVMDLAEFVLTHFQEVQELYNKWADVRNLPTLEKFKIMEAEM